MQRCRLSRSGRCCWLGSPRKSLCCSSCRCSALHSQRWCPPDRGCTRRRCGRCTCPCCTTCMLCWLLARRRCLLCRWCRRWRCCPRRRCLRDRQRTPARRSQARTRRRFLPPCSSWRCPTPNTWFQCLTRYGKIKERVLPDCTGSKRFALRFVQSSGLHTQCTPGRPGLACRCQGRRTRRSQTSLPSLLHTVVPGTGAAALRRMHWDKGRRWLKAAAAARAVHWLPAGGASAYLLRMPLAARRSTIGFG